MMVNNKLVGGAIWCNKHLEKMMEFVNGKDDKPYIMENRKWLKPPVAITRYEI